MKPLDVNQDQLQKIKSHPGFIAALDQSGGIVRNQRKRVVQRG
jgi:fructose-bisphosphate aldolase class 1